MINTINPATGVLEKTFARLVYAEIEVYVQNTFDAYRCYRQTSLMQRAEWLNNLSDLERKIMGEKGRDYVRVNHNIKHLSDLYIKLFEQF